MNPISDTAFYTCGVRAVDAELPDPVCADSYANLFMNERGKRIFEGFKNDTGPNKSNVARHRMIDDLLRERLAANTNTQVVIIGAGFDTRAYRLDGGQWTELDEPQVIDYKNVRLPVDQCKNPLQRIAVDFSKDRLEEKLPPLASGVPVVVVMEGVFGYLTEAQIGQNLRTLKQAFPGHTLICDLMSKWFLEFYGRRMQKKINQLGASFKFFHDDPASLFRQAGYRLKSSHSIVPRTFEFDNARFALFLVTVFFRQLCTGYTIHVFETATEAAEDAAPA